MPSNSNFGFSVLIAGLPVPEYCQDGKVYVESNLWTPVSYNQRVREHVYGEVEEQAWPVTPYQIKVYTLLHCPQSFFSVYVDGVKVGKKALKHGKEWVCQGFDDADGEREFLFSLPRFARDESDRVESTRHSKIGTIEVTCHAAKYHGKRLKKVKDTEFDQANKKDANSVTGGKHTLSTTKKGRLLQSRQTPYSTMNTYGIGEELGRLTVEYHTAHTLQEKGLVVQRMDWNESQNLTAVAVKTE